MNKIKKLTHDAGGELQKILFANEEDIEDSKSVITRAVNEIAGMLRAVVDETKPFQEFYQSIDTFRKDKGCLDCDCRACKEVKPNGGCGDRTNPVNHPITLVL